MFSASTTYQEAVMVMFKKENHPEFKGLVPLTTYKRPEPLITAVCLDCGWRFCAGTYHYEDFFREIDLHDLRWPGHGVQVLDDLT